MIEHAKTSINSMYIITESLFPKMISRKINLIGASSWFNSLVKLKAD